MSSEKEITTDVASAKSATSITAPSVTPSIKNEDISSEERTEATWSPEAERSMKWKIDFRIMPQLMILIILNFIDRGNLANARLKGLETDLKLHGAQFASCLSVVYGGYVFMQIPSNLFLSSIPYPNVYLGLCVALWGLISGLTATVSDYSGLIACRFFLGFVEAALYPGAMYFLSRWYTKREVGLRITLFNVGNLLAQAFGGLMAAGILDNMDGKNGIAGWRWLYIIEGTLTVFFAFCAIAVLPTYPEKATWLTPEEQKIAVSRLTIMDDIVVAADDGKRHWGKAVRETFTDIKVLWLALSYFMNLGGLSFSGYFPTIVKTLGYDTNKTLLLTAPPWAFAAILAYFNSLHSDHVEEKYYHWLWPQCSSLIGYIILMATNQHAVAARYFSLFLLCTGYASGFVQLSWISTSIRGSPARRAASFAFVNAMGNVENIAASYFYPVGWGPSYKKSFGVTFALGGGAIISNFFYSQYLKRLNKKLDADPTAPKFRYIT